MKQLNRSWLRDVVARALAEDIGYGDITTQATISEDQKASGVFVAKEEGVICGLPLIEEIFHYADPSLLVSIWVDEGSRVKPGDVLAEV